MLERSWLSPSGRQSSSGGTLHPRSLCRPLVSSILPFVSRSGRAVGGARPGGRPYDGLAMGSTLCTGARGEDSTVSETDEQILAGGRDLRANQGPLVLPLSSHRFGGSDDRFLSVGVSFCRCGQGIVGQGAGRPFSPSAEGDQHGQGQVLSSSAS